VGEDMLDTWFCFLDKRGFRLLEGVDCFLQQQKVVTVMYSTFS
jgi:hypothetical protein